MNKTKSNYKLSALTIERLANVVPHPRYGSKIILSDQGTNDKPIEVTHFSFTEVRFPESAILADKSKHNFSTMSHINWYMDTLLDCLTCRKPFLFFALEQQYWYETLRFRVESVCLNCPNCRKTERELQQRWQRYSNLIVREQFADEELLQLAEDTVFLWQHGLLRSEQRLREIRNRVHRQIQRSSIASELDKLIAAIKD
tara:strand:+ start:9990 stop:10589 length:600 start_codon:yes stop_codon:yes gene_type:complete